MDFLKVLHVLFLHHSIVNKLKIAASNGVRHRLDEMDAEVVVNEGFIEGRTDGADHGAQLGTPEGMKLPLGMVLPSWVGVKDGMSDAARVDGLVAFDSMIGTAISPSVVLGFMDGLAIGESV